MGANDETQGPDPSRTILETGAVRHEWDGTERPSLAIVEAVAAATDREPTAVPSLHDAVDTDALDRLLRSGGDGADRAVQISFSYAGTLVVVDSGGTVTVRLRDGV